MTTTTIAVKKSTLQILSDLKKEEGAATIDEIILELVGLKKNLPVSLKGAYPNISKMSQKDEEVFDEI